jgi:hypothetical protein
MECTCNDWIENIDKLNEAITLLTARNPTYKGYTGKIIIYCPWCGEKLKETK